MSAAGCGDDCDCDCGCCCGGGDSAVSCTSRTSTEPIKSPTQIGYILAGASVRIHISRGQVLGQTSEVHINGCTYHRGAYDRSRAYLN